MGNVKLYVAFSKGGIDREFSGYDFLSYSINNDNVNVGTSIVADDDSCDTIANRNIEKKHCQ